MFGRFILQALYVIIFEILPTFINDRYKPITFRHTPRPSSRFKPKPVPRPKPTKPFGKYKRKP